MSSQSKAKVYCKNNSLAGTSRCRSYTQLNYDGYCPKCAVAKRKFHCRGVEVKYPCGSCREEVGDQHQSVCCRYCEKWFHIVCADVSPDTYDVMMRDINKTKLTFNCEKCDEKITEVFSTSKGLDARANGLANSMQELQNRLDRLESKVAGEVGYEVTAALDQKMEIEKRKMSLIIFNLPEPLVQDGTDGNCAKDLFEVTQMISKELGLESNITDTRRLGAKKTSSSKYKSRPLKISFSSLKAKRDVLTKAMNLRDSQDPVYKEVYINPDLTPAQRQRERTLREEMWRIRSTEQRHVIIQKGQIVNASYKVQLSREERRNSKFKLFAAEKATKKQKTTTTVPHPDSDITFHQHREKYILRAGKKKTGYCERREIDQSRITEVMKPMESPTLMVKLVPKSKSKLDEVANVIDTISNRTISVSQIETPIKKSSVGPIIHETPHRSNDARSPQTKGRLQLLVNTPKSPHYSQKESMKNKIVELARDPDVKSILRPYNIMLSDPANISTLNRLNGEYLKKTAEFLITFSEGSNCGLTRFNTSVPKRRDQLPAFIVQWLKVLLNLAPGGAPKKTKRVVPSPGESKL